MHNSSKKVLIIGCGLGNIHNLSRAITSLGFLPVITDKPEEVLKSHIVILPGVGSFNTGMERLQQANLDEAIKTHVQKGNHLLGICLGMQLLFNSSEENGYRNGLGILSGDVKRLNQHECKIPQINWNFLEKPTSNTNWENGLLKDITNPCMYFIHSYGVSIENNSHVVAKTTYGQNVFCSIANQNNIWGCQFHPEISGPQGLKLIENFLIGCE